MTRPNVLLILTDQQRPDTLGFRAETPCRTPNIDRIAAQGVSFDRAMTPCPLCLPSRAALFTGRYPTQNDMMSNAEGSLTSCEMFDQFRSAGYRVNYSGKWHMGENNIGDFTDRHAGDSTVEYSRWCLDQGLIDGWMFNDPATRTRRKPSMSVPKVHRQNLPVDKTNEGYITDLALNMIRSRDRELPFFQVVSYNGPHPPFMIPEPFFSMYDRAAIPKPANFGPQYGETPINEQSYYRRLFEDHGSDFETWRESYAVYWGFVSMIDHFVGQVLSVLEVEKLLDDTIVVFASDHGENLGAHGLWQKMVPYEESIRVPLLFRVPGDARLGYRSAAPASLIDVAPTLAALCGVNAVPNWPGRNLWRADWSTSEGPSQFAMHRPLGDWMGVTDWRMIDEGQFKYVWHNGHGEELFNLATDPHEIQNLAGDLNHRDRLVALRKDLGRFLEETADPLLANWKHDPGKLGSVH